MIALVDNNLPPRLARALAALFDNGWKIEALRDRMPESTPDIEIIARMDTTGPWMLISADLRIARNRAERQAIRNSRAIGFFLAPGLGKAPIARKAARIILLWDKMVQQIGLAQPGAMFEISFRGEKFRQIVA